MTDLKEKLEQLGLSQYLEIFVTEGFDTWETILDVRESDLDILKVKLGHRRKLQRAIAETRGQLADHAVPSLQGAPSVDGSYRSDESASEAKILKRRDPSAVGAGGGSTKRKYRRHPKPDEHAPERPASAYVIFSNQMREALKGQELTFTEIAKLVGERWQTLSPESREACERQAAAAKEKYYSELAEYKKTASYTRYQEYLVDFKAKHAPTQTGQQHHLALKHPLIETEGKRSKLETETSMSTRSSSHENNDKSSRRRVSDAYFTAPNLVHQRSGSSPPPNRHPRRHGRPLASESTSPNTYSYSGLNSPRLQDHQHSPMSASPTSANLHRDPGPDYNLQNQPGHPTDLRERNMDSSYGPMPGYGFKHANAAPVLGSPVPSFSLPAGSGDLPSRRIHRDSSSLPSLTHDTTTDTNVSSESASYSNVPYQSGPLLPQVDAPKAYRMLPQPVPTHGVAQSPLDPRPPTAVTLPLPNQDYRHNSSLAVLLRAGEMARDAEAMPDGKTNPP
ncbi:hypothetical protein K490DRAFT_62167 [Saccharata proteae CBS 121410]|uniref:HMG box domain-containing protein n=1 Tax=Saccharata proteae CBS 121410 TaxID=1314787 RepID=A0A9P4I144_9PEZI|nr:hypothetical protein K490DRAFT_62167 [Saccharata proteae CBS 121410]